ncbi:hypothetical protein [Pelomonas sp. SE-A7]|uniref:hypothetical protein n=1 Tax=Pelomonas sp. SE-A7 TaxID=3054953 RepID=UPI00259D25E2|nr:hypothetical protein [Pelomonas sp. SE-A7]MDM4765973.1 hypothetical protein [Pelomonas sp. SE-A7]
MTSPTRRLSLEEVLDEFFFSADKPSPTMVLRACEAHPEYREDILEFAALWSSYEASPEVAAADVADISEESVSRLQSYVLNQIHELDGNSVPSSNVEATKRAVSTLAGGKLGRAATAAGFASSLLLTKVLTTITNVPPRVIRDLAKHLHVAPADLRQCIGPQFVGARNYSSARQPDAPSLETWESAVRSLPESEDEKKRLLGFQTEEEA